MIEGDEGEVVPPDGVPRGETLLSNQYMLVEGRPQTKSLPSRGVEGRQGVEGGQRVEGRQSGKDPGGPPSARNEPAPLPITTSVGGVAIEVSSPAVIKSLSLQEPIRPVTPQSFRPHSSANVRSCKGV